MIDTAVDASHPVLLGQRIETRALYTPKGRSAPADHGTAIAALLIGKPSKDGLGGLLPGAELKAANIFELSETGEPVGHASSFLRAINWLVRMHVDVVNIGLTSANNKMVRKAMKRAVDFGLIVVAAAGNHG